MGSTVPGKVPAHTPASPVYGWPPSGCRCSWAWTGGQQLRLKILSGSCQDHAETPRVHWDDQPRPWGEWQRDGDRALMGGLFRGLAVVDQ